MEGDSYSEGVVINASEIADLTNKSEPITECNRTHQNCLMEAYL